MFYKTIKAGTQSGAITVEFMIVSLFLMIAFLLTLQIGFIYHGKLVLNYAVFEAARTGAVNNAQVSVMRNELGIRLAPLIAGDGSREAALRSIALSSAWVRDTTSTQMKIVNPTPEAFDDWGVSQAGINTRIIPNSHLRHQSNAIGARSGLTLQDANLLKLEVTHGLRLRVPIAGKLIARLLLGADSQRGQYYLRGQFPLTSVATVRMQSNAWEAEIVSVASQGSESGHDETSVASQPVAPATGSQDPSGTDSASASQATEIADADGGSTQTSESEELASNDETDCADHDHDPSMIISTAAYEAYLSGS